MIDRYCILKMCAKNLLRDYGEDAYNAFIKINPKGAIMPKQRNEYTSPAVARTAGKLMREADKRIAACYMMISALQAQLEFLKATKSVIASALTQSKDRK